MINSSIKILFIFGILLILSRVGEEQADDTEQSTDTSKTVLKHNLNITDSLLHIVENESVSLELLLLINKNIDDREKLIYELEKDVNSTNYDVFVLKQSVRDLNSELNDIKAEYAKMIYYAYKNRNPHERLIYVLSAKNFNQSYKRLKFLRYYSEFRKKQAKRILENKNKLALKIDTLSDKLKLEKQILQNVRSEKYNLLETKEKRGEIIKILLAHKEEFLKENAIKNILKEKLENQLVTHIKSDVEDRQKAIKAKSFSKKRLPDKIIEKDFENNKGKLPWPVNGGVVYNTFGLRPHPVFDKVILKNNGVDISIKPGNKAFSVFNGVVKKVIAIPGKNQAVLISHGDFYSVYANLEDVYVKPGESIKTRELIGLVYTDIEEGNLTTLQFQIWYKTKIVNPLDWIVQKEVIATKQTKQ